MSASSILSVAVAQIRFVGIRPRVKMTANQEPRPTQVCILGPGDFKSSVELEDEQAELDFVLGRYPLGYRKVVVTDGVMEDISKVAQHHVKLGDDEKPEKIPSAYEGLRQGDVVAMALGGSGDNLAFALSRQGENVGAIVKRIPPFLLQEKRGDASKDDDAKLLASLVQAEVGLFTKVVIRERAIVRVRELYRLRTDTMKARMACAQRVRQRYIGEIFCKEDGLFPQGAIEIEFAERKASDKILLAIEAEEARALRDMEKAVEATDIWQQVFEPIEGIGPAIAARLITAIQDIRRFSKSSKLRKFCGAHCLDDGSFPRRRQGQVSNWHPDARQALYLLADQFFRRPKTEWGMKLRANMEGFRKIHPYPVIIVNKGEAGEEKIELVPGTFVKDSKGNYTFSDGPAAGRQVRGTMKYNDLHIRKMGMWRTVSQFLDFLFDSWWKLEKKVADKPEESSDGAAAA